MLAHSFLIESSSKLMVSRTGIKAWSSSILGQISPTHFGVTCPWVTKISHFWTLISLKPVGQSWSNFMCSIIGVGERLHEVFGQIGSKLWFPWKKKSPHWLIMGFLIRSFLYLQATRTCIKSRRILNLGQIGLLTMELAALECLKNFP